VLFHNNNTNKSGYTLAEILIAMGITAVFGTALLGMWSALGGSFMNQSAYALRQSDQMRVFDYLKRDIRRASSIVIRDAAGLAVAGNAFGVQIDLTIPDYYSDAREEDNVFGSKVINTPSLSGTSPSYGGTLTVKYYVSNGAVIREESGTARTVADADGVFTVSFSNDVSGMIRCRVTFNDPLRSATGKVLRRTVDILCLQRTQLLS